jgi:hypothetical protein
MVKNMYGIDRRNERNAQDGDPARKQEVREAFQRGRAGWLRMLWRARRYSSAERASDRTTCGWKLQPLAMSGNDIGPVA